MLHTVAIVANSPIFLNILYEKLTLRPHTQKIQELILLKKTVILTEHFNSFLSPAKQITDGNHFPLPSSQLFHNFTLYSTCSCKQCYVNYETTIYQLFQLCCFYQLSVLCWWMQRMIVRWHRSYMSCSTQAVCQNPFHHLLAPVAAAVTSR